MTTVASVKTFVETGTDVLHVLQERLGMRLWMITRTERDDSIVVAAVDRGYGVRRGHVFCWSDSFCARMVRGDGPAMACDIEQIPAYASAPIINELPVRAYAGMPLRLADGRLFGTLCALDPEPQGERLSRGRELLTTSARLLTSALEGEFAHDLRRHRAERIAHGPRSEGLTDLAGWRMRCTQFEELYRQYASAFALAHLKFDYGLRDPNAGARQGKDEIARRAGALIQSHVRTGDVVARLADDELGLLLASSDSVSLERVLRKVQGLLADHGISVSTGGALRQHHVSLDATAEEAALRLENSLPRRHGVVVPWPVARVRPAHAEVA
jgi:diguanylate cyclase